MMAPRPLHADAGSPRSAERPARGVRVRRWAAVALLAAIPLFAAGWLWRPILGNYFWGDDFANLFLICNRPLPEYLLAPHAGHLLVVRNAVFYVMARLFGTDARWYFTIVWWTHLLNVALLFATTLRFTASGRIACVAAVLFGTCPAIEGTLGWYAVYGHVLAGTAVLLILYDAAGLYARGAEPRAVRRWLWAAIALGAMLSFGVGVGIAAALPLALAALFPQPLRRRVLPPLWPLMLVVPALYAGLFVLYRRVGSSGAVFKSQYLTDDLMARLGDMLRFTVALIMYAIDRLLSGPFPLPPYPSPVGLWVAVAAVALAIGAALRGPRRLRRVLLGATVLLLACYATIGAGRFSLTDYMSLAEAVAQPRYYYVGILILALIVGAVLASASANRVGQVLFVPWLSMWLITCWLNPPAIDPHLESRTEASFLVAWMRSLADRAAPGQEVYIPNRTFHAISPLFINRHEFPGWAGLFSIYYPDPTIDGHRVFFVERDPGVRATHRTSRRLASVLVAPEAVPAQLSPLAPSSPLLGYGPESELEDVGPPGETPTESTPGPAADR